MPGYRPNIAAQRNDAMGHDRDMKMASQATAAFALAVLRQKS